MMIDKISKILLDSLGGCMKKKVIGIIGGLGILWGLGILCTLYGIFTRPKKVATITVIGEADGPTAIYLAGNVETDFSIAMIIIGAILVVITVFLLIKKHNK